MSVLKTTVRVLSCTAVVLGMVGCSSRDGTPLVQLPVITANAEAVAESALDGLDNMFGGAVTFETTINTTWEALVD